MKRKEKHLKAGICIVAFAVALMLVITPALHQGTTGSLVIEQLEEKECGVCGALGDEGWCVGMAAGAQYAIDMILSGEADFGQDGFYTVPGNGMGQGGGIGNGFSYDLTIPSDELVPEGATWTDEEIIERLTELIVWSVDYECDEEEAPEWLIEYIRKMALCLSVALTPILGLEIALAVVAVYRTTTIQFGLILIGFGIFGLLYDTCAFIYNQCMEIIEDW